jgi:SH3-like domain-containing protein
MWELRTVRWLQFVTFAALSCVPRQPVSEPLANEQHRILSRPTELPAWIAEAYDPEKLTDQVDIDRELLDVAKISRPKALLRLGPGVQFPVQSQILVEGDIVLIFDAVGVWKKVVQPETHIAGWVHMETLVDSASSSKAIGLQTASLPTVFAMRDIQKVYKYPDRQAVAVKIPKGAMFKLLKKDGDAALIWLAQSNSVIWVNKENFQ